MLRMLAALWLAMVMVIGVFGCAVTNGSRVISSAVAGDSSDAGSGSGLRSLERKCKDLARRVAIDPAVMAVASQIGAGGSSSIDELDALARARTLEDEWRSLGCTDTEFGRRILPSGVRAELRDEAFARRNDVNLTPGEPMIDARPTGER